MLTTKYWLNREEVETIICDSPSKLVLPGDNCQVRDLRSGYEFNLSSLKGKDYQVRNDKYIYHLSVCGGLQRDICTHKDTGSETVSSCQVDGANQKIGGTDQNQLNILVFDLTLYVWICVIILVFITYVCVCVFSRLYICAGMANQLLSYVGDQLILNYTNGETCHQIYKRSTEIYFSCHPDRHPVSFTHAHKDRFPAAHIVT